MPFPVIIVSLDSEIGGFNYLSTQNIQKDNLFYDEQPFDLRGVYHYMNSKSYKSDSLKEHVFDFFKESELDLKISNDVLDQCYNVIDKIYPSMLEYLSIDNVYSTSYGTIVFDWERDVDNVFSLEIGARELGYFIEVDGKDIKQVDSFTFDENQDTFMYDLSSFLSV